MTEGDHMLSLLLLAPVALGVTYWGMSATARVTAARFNKRRH